MSEDKCTARYKRETQIFWELVHVDGEQEYKCMILKIKEISLEFVDDLDTTKEMMTCLTFPVKFLCSDFRTFYLIHLYMLVLTTSRYLGFP